MFFFFITILSWLSRRLIGDWLATSCIKSQRGPHDVADQSATSPRSVADHSPTSRRTTAIPSRNSSATSAIVMNFGRGEIAEQLHYMSDRGFKQPCMQIWFLFFCISRKIPMNKRSFKLKSFTNVPVETFLILFMVGVIFNGCHFSTCRTCKKIDPCDILSPHETHFSKAKRLFLNVEKWHLGRFSTGVIIRRYTGRKDPCCKHYKYKEWVSFFWVHGNESYRGTNKSSENRFAVHAMCLSCVPIHSQLTQNKDIFGSRTICLFRATIHLPWTQNKTLIP